MISSDIIDWYNYDTHTLMNKYAFFAVTLLVGIAIFARIVSNVGIDRIIAAVFALKPYQFASLIIINAAGFLISTIRWRMILVANGDIVPFGKVLAARMVGFSINYLTPSGLIMGEPFKAVVLSGESNVKLGSAMVSIVIEAAIFLSTFLLFVILGIISFITYSNLSWRIFTSTLLILAFMLSVFYLFYSKMMRKSSPGENEKGFFTFIIDLLHLHNFAFIRNLKTKISQREKEIRNFFSLHRNTVYAAILLSILEMIVMIASYWLTIYYLGFTISAQTLLGIVALMSVASLLPLPASLGGFELSQVFAFSFFGLGGQITAIGFSLITRIISLFFVIIGIIYLAYFETKQAIIRFCKALPEFGEKIKSLFIKTTK